MEPIVYDLADRPNVEVRHDGEWLPGSLRMWSWRGEWVADVGYARDGTTFLGTFVAGDVREDAVDRALGRGVTPRHGSS